MNYLQHFVGGGLNSGNKVGWTESRLFNLSKVVDRVAIQHHLAHWDERIVLVGPNLEGERVYLEFGYNTRK